MLRVENLRVSYGGERILRGVDLEVADGECLAVIGESGAGKTTLGLSIMGLLNGNASGGIHVDDADILSLSEEEIRDIRWNRVAMAFQSAQNRLNPSHRIIDQIAEPIIAHRLKSKPEARQRAAELLRDVGLQQVKFSHYPHQLSTGEQQRVLIAMALTNDPRTVILDEPISSLDASSRTEMLVFLKQSISGRTALLMTHDFSTVAKLASKTATLYGGKIVELAQTSELLSRPRHPYTRALLRSYPNMTTTKDLQGIMGRMERDVTGCTFHPRCTQAIPVCQRQVPLLMEHGGRLVACHRGGIIAALSAHGLRKLFGSI